jgi:hypothetical protein
VIKAHQRAPDRQSGNEGPCAIDRIDDPDIVPIQSDIAVLLAENAVIGKPLGDDLPDRLFGGPVCLGDRIETGRCLLSIATGMRNRGSVSAAAASAMASKKVMSGSIGFSVKGRRRSPGCGVPCQVVLTRLAQKCKFRPDPGELFRIRTKNNRPP